MKIDKNKLFKILKKIQQLQNKYVDLKKKSNALEMAKVMWDIGDFLLENGIKNPHSFGWEAERQKAFIKRPLVFRSFVTRRIWDDKEKLEREIYGIKSINSLIEFFPFLDQNNRWKVPDEIIKNLFNSLNTKPAKIFNRELKTVKEKYIGIKNDRSRYLKDYANLKRIFYNFFNKVKNLMKEGSMEECSSFVDKVNKNNLKKLGKLCLYIATKKDIDTKLFKPVTTNYGDFDALYRMILELIKSKEKSNRIRRVIDPLDLIKTTDFCNSIINKEGIKAYRIREGFKLSIK